MSLQQVHLRVNDAATGQPTPVRLRITDADGAYYAPHGRLTEFATGVNQDVGGNVQIGAKKWAYIDGACEILLPPGPLHIEITKGPEYTPIDETITLLAGKMAMRFTIARWSDIRKQGWHSGDTRVHFLSPDAALLEGQAEDVAVVNLLVKETLIPDVYGKAWAIPNLLSFSGQSYARAAGGCGVSVGTQNYYERFGTLGLLHCHRIVFPLRILDGWTFGDWCGQCHRKKGLAIWTEVAAGHLCRGPLADLILGDVDAIELLLAENSPMDALADYYKFVNAGVPVPLVGASGKQSNTRALGALRTYAHLPAGQELTYSAWIEAVRAGGTFVSNGPILHFTINDEVPSISNDRPNDKSLRIHAEARSLAPFGHLEVLWNGEPIAMAAPGTTCPFEATLNLEWAVEATGWIAVRCRGAESQPAFAHSSAFVIRREGTPDWAKPKEVEALLEEVESLLTYVHGHGFTELCRVVEKARTVLVKRLS